MKRIKLTQEKIAFVDDEDFVRVSQYKWCITKGKNTYYADNWKVRLMHRFIMNPPTNM